MLRARERPERRRRGDLAVAAFLVLLVVAVAVGYGLSSPAANTESVPATSPGVQPAPAPDVPPAALVEAWRAPSAAAPVPVVSGPGVVTAAGGTVVGRDATTGAERWTYTRDRELCTVTEGFGQVLALYPSADGTWCSELTALASDLGTRGPASNLDVRPGARLAASGSTAVASSADYLEAMRSDLVTTLQYGAVVAPAQPDRQPRPGCTYTSLAVAAGRLGVIEDCPADAADRLTVLRPDGTGDADTPKVEFSVPLATRGTQLLAVSADRAAVLLPGPPELQILDREGDQVGLIGLDVPESEVAPPADRVGATAGDSDRVYWWSGSRTVALDRSGLAPVWTLRDTLGAGVEYGGSWLLPTRAGLAVVDPVRGAVLRTIPVDRGGFAGPVVLAADGQMLYEQRGDELVALRPA
ncbi:Rv3212 family protein [Pseudonocardia xishanensis]|uniref:Pyrroloquinoline-quinone binding quinoprotein n=1 Tax=Pseudonocardia xishanensis TaxID=630995 RepID=A0ABP8S2T6_9PSEU